MEENKNEEKDLLECTTEKVEKIVKKIVDEDTIVENIEVLSQLIDIHKDIKEEENMYRGSYGNDSYNEYGDSYGRRGVAGTGRGRYRGNSYGRRGVAGTGRGSYRGNDMLEEMSEHFGNYSESREYGADDMKSLRYMLKALEDFGMYLMEDVDSEEQAEMIKQTFRKLASN